MVDSPKTGSKELGELLRRARERRGMSRNDLVEASGLSYPYVSQLETAYRMPSPAAIRKLADALGISLDDIFAAMSKPSPEPLSVRKRVDDSGWIPNDAYSRPAEMSDIGRVEVAALRSAPVPRTPAPAEAAGSAGGAGRSVPTTSIVEKIVRLFNEVPPQERMDALARVQARVVDSVIDEGVRRGRSSR